MEAHGRASHRRWTAATLIALLCGAVIALALSTTGTARAAGLPCLVGCSTTTTTATSTTPTATTPPTTTTTPTVTTPPTTTTTSAPPVKPIPLVVANAEYDGRSAENTASVFVARSGKQLNGYEVGFLQGRCSDGGRYGGGDNDTRLITIKAGGRVSQTLTNTHAYWFTKAGKQVDGTERYTVHLHFDHTRITGTLTDRFRSKHLSCASGSVRLVAYEDGTRQATIRDLNAGSGTYRGDHVDAQMFLPWHELTKISFDYYLDCPGTSNPKLTATYYGVPLSQNDGWTIEQSTRVRLKNGYSAQIDVTANGSFNPLSSGGATKTTYEMGTDVASSVSYYDAHGNQVPDASCSNTDSYETVGPTFSGTLTYLPSQY